MFRSRGGEFAPCSDQHFTSGEAEAIKRAAIAQGFDGFRKGDLVFVDSLEKK